MVSFIFTLLNSQFRLPYGLQNYETQYWINEPCKGTNYLGSHFCIDYSVIKETVSTLHSLSEKWKLKPCALHLIAYWSILLPLFNILHYIPRHNVTLWVSQPRPVWEKIIKCPPNLSLSFSPVCESTWYTLAKETCKTVNFWCEMLKITAKNSR